MRKAAKEPRTAEEHQIRAITDKIAGLGLVCSGTLLERTKTCGKANCRCATDPEARHGPYHEWSWREGGKLRHKIVSAAEAEQLREAIKNHRKAQELLTKWERESAAIIFRDRGRKSHSGKKRN